MQDFSGLPKTLSAALAQKGYTSLTPVQQAVTDTALAGKDLLVSAQTGSGKTVGFGLAMANDILDENGKFDRPAAPLAVVIAPTRELALQVQREFDWLFAEAGIVTASAVGGIDPRTERRALERGAHIVVATPGRLRDHTARGVIDLDDVRTVVLDEADEMLDMGFAEDLEYILEQAPDTRRTLMFSATVPRGIAKLAQTYQKEDAERIKVGSPEEQHSDITYSALIVAPSDIEKAIINLLCYHDAQTAIVFANTRSVVARLTAKFANRGFAVVSLSGELTQSERTNAMQALRDGRANVCVATDVAARGIDLPGLELVIHADLPSNAETLLHRSGRTGRAGRKGESVLIVPARHRAKAQRLLKFAKLDAEWGTPPSAEEVSARQEERIISNPALDQAPTDEELAFAERLLSGRTPEQVAAAYLRLFRDRNSAPELLDTSPDAGKRSAEPRAPFGPSTWFSLSMGRDQRAEARWLLPMLCRSGGMSKDDIGAIRVQQNETFIEIATTAVAGLKRELGDAMTIEQGATLTELDRAPDLAPAGRGRPSGPRPSFDGPKGRGPRPDRPARPDRPDRPAKSFDRPAKSHDRPAKSYDRGEKSFDKPAKSFDRPEKSFDKPARKFDRDGDGDRAKPRGKPAARVWDKPARGAEGDDRGKPRGKPSGKPAGKSWDKPAGKSKPAWDKSPKDGPKRERSKSKPADASDKPRTTRKAALDPSKPMGARKARHSARAKAGKPGGDGKPFRKPSK